jgi:threonine synthase
LWTGHDTKEFSYPKGAAATAAYDRLLATGFLKSTDHVVLFNTGGGLKYTEVTAEAMGLKHPGPGETL